MLSGGLDADTVFDAIQTILPWGVDASSGIESAPGIKDAGLIEAFFLAVAEARVRRDHAAPVPAERRAELLVDPGFGRVFTDHMVTIRYVEGRGWHDARVEARARVGRPVAGDSG